MSWRKRLEYARERSFFSSEDKKYVTDKALAANETWELANHWGFNEARQVEDSEVKALQRLFASAVLGDRIDEADRIFHIEEVAIGVQSHSRRVISGVLTKP